MLVLRWKILTILFYIVDCTYYFFYKSLKYITKSYININNNIKNVLHVYSTFQEPKDTLHKIGK